jgi:hypothetical protein
MNWIRTTKKARDFIPRSARPYIPYLRQHDSVDSFSPAAVSNGGSVLEHVRWTSADAADGRQQSTVDDTDMHRLFVDLILTEIQTHITRIEQEAVSDTIL